MFDANFGSYPAPAFGGQFRFLGPSYGGGGYGGYGGGGYGGYGGYGK
jgi:hypothetical protein